MIKYNQDEGEKSHGAYRRTWISEARPNILEGRWFLRIWIFDCLTNHSDDSCPFWKLWINTTAIPNPTAARIHERRGLAASIDLGSFDTCSSAYSRDIVESLLSVVTFTIKIWFPDWYFQPLFKSKRFCPSVSYLAKSLPFTLTPIGDNSEWTLRTSEDRVEDSSRTWISSLSAWMNFIEGDLRFTSKHHTKLFLTWNRQLFPSSYGKTLSTYYDVTIRSI